MRKLLDKLYLGAAALAALFMVGLLVMVLLSMLGRMFHFYVPGTDAYAGYAMAGAGFLALAHLGVEWMYSGRVPARLTVWLVGGVLGLSLLGGLWLQPKLKEAGI